MPDPPDNRAQIVVLTSAELATLLDRVYDDLAAQGDPDTPPGVPGEAG